MNAIRNLRNIYAIFFSINILVMAWFVIRQIPGGAVVFGVSGAVMLVCLCTQSKRLFAVALIWDNRILAVPSAFISTAGGKGKKDTEETVVSTFGILIGTKIYRWGCDGVHGVRLNAIEIDKERMYLTFGDATQAMRVELLHGMVEQQAVLDVRQKLWNETGVMASISGW